MKKSKKLSETQNRALSTQKILNQAFVPISKLTPHSDAELMSLLKFFLYFRISGIWLSTRWFGWANPAGFTLIGLFGRGTLDLKLWRHFVIIPFLPFLIVRVLKIFLIICLVWRDWRKGRNFILDVSQFTDYTPSRRWMVNIWLLLTG